MFTSPRYHSTIGRVVQSLYCAAYSVTVFDTDWVFPGSSSAYPQATGAAAFIGGLITALFPDDTKDAIAVAPDPDSVNRDLIYSNTYGRSALLTVINDTWFKRVRVLHPEAHGNPFQKKKRAKRG